MRLWLGFTALGAMMIAATHLLCRRGIAVTKRIAAVLFVFRTGKNADRVSLDSCTGWVRHAGRFRESGIYTFTLDCQLSKGNAAVSLLDGKKRELFRLDRHVTTGTAELHRGERYYLRWDFQSATGTCALLWEGHFIV